MAFLVFLAACASAPPRSEFDEGPADRLVVVNDTAVAIVVHLDGTRLGRVAAGQTESFDPGRSAGPRSTLHAAGRGVDITATLRRPPWGVRWRVR